MAVPPPSDDLDGPGSTEFGIAALDAHLDAADLSFPATAEEVVRALDDPQIDYEPGGDAVRLSRLLERVDRERFESRSALLDALHPEFERLRRSGAGDLLHWLRSLLGE